MGIARSLHRASLMTNESWRVLWQNKGLFVLPVANAASLGLVVAAFSAPYWSETGPFAGLDDDTTNLFTIAYGFVFYLAITAVATFFNAALIHCVLRRLAGEPASPADGLALAVKRLPQILAWAAIAATVGILMRAVREKLGGVAEFLFGVAEMAFAMATFFVVPVLVVEGVGPLEAIRRSTAIMRHTWGTSLAADFGVGFLIVIAIFAGLLLLVALVGLVPNEVFYVVPFVIGAVLALIILVLTTLSTVLRAALYRFATTGEVPPQYDRALLESAFVEKPAK